MDGGPPLDVERLKELVDTDERRHGARGLPRPPGPAHGQAGDRPLFRDHVLDGSIEACNYLLAVDVDMTPLPGYRYANWDQGYGDFSAVPDLATLRLVPWIEKTALVLCDLVDEEGRGPGRGVAPAHPAQPDRAGGRDGLPGATSAPSSSSSCSRTPTPRRPPSDYRTLTPHADWIEDYHILQTTRDEYLIRQIRNGMDAAGVPVEFSKGEAGQGQHEINLVFAEALEMADRHAIYKNGAKEIADLNGRSLTFMAKYSMDEVGLVLPHPLERVGQAGSTLAACGIPAPATTSRRCSAAGSAGWCTRRASCRGSSPRT